MTTKRTLLLIAIFLVPFYCQAQGLQLHSVNPAITSTGELVQVLGEGFAETTRVVLGSQELTPVFLNPNQVQFRVPQLPEGSYSLQLRTANQTTSQTLSLLIELPAPSITRLSPANINECSTAAERRVRISGDNFQPGLNLLLNGAAIPASVQNLQQISFDAPHLNAGIYGLQVINPNDKSSLPHSLYFNNIPKISSLSVGENFVSSYQLIIQGKNFYPHSTLVVSEYQSEFSDTPPLQRIIRGRNSGSNVGSGKQGVRGDYLNYIDCNTLIYYRFPYSGQDKQLSLQVVNRDGKSSAIEQVSMP